MPDEVPGHSGPPRTVRLAQTWGLALFLGTVGLSAVAALMPEPPAGRHLTGLEVTLHVHLPWTVIAAVMGLTSGLLWREQWTWAGVLAMPLLLGVVAAVVDVPGEASTVLFLLEGTFGALIGWIVAEVLGAVRDDDLMPREERPGWRSAHRRS
ncbi:MAG: hypothetical protein ABIS86_17720 [Streptosporangiaceae bacterium]